MTGPRGPGGNHTARRREPRLPAVPADPEDVAAAEEVAARILAGAAQSAVALQRRLQHRGFSAAAAAQATATMAERGYVDDAAFAQSIAGRRQRTGHGRIAVIAELRAKGLADAAIDGVVTDVDMDAERAAALELGRRLGQRAGRDPQDRSGRQRLGAALQRRGFDGETVRWVIRQLEAGDPAERSD